ncbi:MAG TPA: DUF456 domain-containing protein [Gemmatimonas sp.]|uniref:DUF456 domain-containing protein n=1 Tax=Gemmatimonas sp. TaxID=1962908 RepID=UPI002ED95C93
MLAIVLLLLTMLFGLVLVPFGLPGLWIMLGGALVYWIAVPAGSIGGVTFGILVALVLVAEVLEFTISGSYARKYGGSRRAGWGAILGGIVGAVVGVPLPIIGSMIGAFAGAFVGALAAEMTVHRSERGEPIRVATGALIGRVVAAATKVAFGMTMIVWVMGAVLVGRLSGTG